MLQLHNTSPFVATIFGLPDQQGVDNLIVVIKATFVLGVQPEIAAQQRPVALADSYWGEPTTSSLRYPGEVHLPKPGTDVIVLGQARAPGGQAVTELEVGVCVGERVKRARVHGDRMWTPGVRRVEPSRARPFVDMPLIYERAFGGPSDPRNPVGLGSVQGQLVPNLDDPDAPLVELGQSPTPVGFGAIAPHWAPRAGYAGTYDQRWRKTRAPYLPDDFDARHQQLASPGLGFDPPLVGGEPIMLVGMHPAGTWRFRLPRCRLDVGATVAGSKRTMSAMLDLVVLEPDAACMTMTWRACLPVDRQLLRVERVDVGLGALELVA